MKKGLIVMNKSHSNQGNMNVYIWCVLKEKSVFLNKYLGVKF